MTLSIKLIVEQHADGFVAYPLGLPATIVGEGDTAAEAIADAESAIRFYFKHYANDAAYELPQEAYLTTAEIEIPA